jgi:hypothetical protein
MKRCLNIDPKEYTECDGEFYTHSENVTERRRKDYNDLTRHELISERKGLLQRLEKLQNFKDKTERYEAFYTIDLSKIEWIRVSGSSGAKSAYQQLKSDIQDGRHKSMDTERLENSRSYFIFSSKHYGIIEPLLEDLKLCRLERLSNRSVGCLILSDSDYVFFWPKVLRQPNQ